MSSQQIAPEINIPVKPMKGKYDGRVLANKTRVKKPTGRKPLHEKHLSRNYAAKLFHEISIREHVHQLLTEKDARLRFEVIRYLWDRLEGKPFVAENPNAAKPVNNILNDNRLQIAIQQLVPPKQERKRKKTQAIEASGEAKQLTQGDSTTQTYVGATSQVVDSTQDGSK